MIWWLQNPDRALAEFAAIAELQQSVTWLRDVKHRMDQSGIFFDFEIVEGDNAWRLTMRYPPFFPNIPPQIFSADKKLISGHQYGAAGELCLEFRPDNWQSSLTGAMMIESAYRLLSGESPGSPSDGVGSAHSLIEGQQLRGLVWRFMVHSEAVALLQQLQPKETVPIVVSEHFHAEVALAHLTLIGSKDAKQWEPAVTVSGRQYSGTAARLPAEMSMPGSYGKDFLDIVLLSLELEPPSPGTTGTYLFVGDDGVWLAEVMKDEAGKETLFDYQTIVLPADPNRLPEENATLAEKRVAMVGCGSLGSKIAAMLVRSGCRNLTLIDADLLMPGNLVRNELDWRSVGAHKVEALKARLLEIAPDAVITTRIVYLGGQESAGWTGATLEAVAACDLIVDATADPTVFGLTSAAARHGEKPMVWAEVFAGGIGGLVARARPKREPPPEVARQQILAWCEQQGVPWQDASSPIDYGVARDQQPLLIADDADVSTIAAHAARLAIDTLKLGSQFPQPAYLIGLSEGWLFTQPFEVHPISYHSDEAWTKLDKVDVQDLNKIVGILFPASDDDASVPAQ